MNLGARHRVQPPSMETRNVGHSSSPGVQPHTQIQTDSPTLSHLFSLKEAGMVGNYTGSQEGEEIWRVSEEGYLSVALKRELVLAAYCNEGGPQAAVRRGPPSCPDARLVPLPRETSLRTSCRKYQELQFSPEVYFVHCRMFLFSRSLSRQLPSGASSSTPSPATTPDTT